MRRLARRGARRRLCLAAFLRRLPPSSPSRRPRRCRTSRSTGAPACGRIAAEPLYREEDGHYQFKYLPAFAVLCDPRRLLPLTAARPSGSPCRWPSSRPCSRSACRCRLSTAQAGHGCSSSAVLWLMAKFYGHELVLGQVNLFSSRSCRCSRCWRWRAAREGRWHGLLVAARRRRSSPYAVLFLPWLAAPRLRASSRTRWRRPALGGCRSLLPAALYGWHGQRRAAPGVVADRRPRSTAPEPLARRNVSLAAMYFAQWFGAWRPVGRALTLATASALLLVAGGSFRWRDGVPRSPTGLEGAMLLTLMPLLSPQGWDYAFSSPTPARHLPRELRRDHLPPAAAYRCTHRWRSLRSRSVLADITDGRAYNAASMPLSIISARASGRRGSLAALVRAPAFTVADVKIAAVCIC